MCALYCEMCSSLVRNAQNMFVGQQFSSLESMGGEERKMMERDKSSL